MKLALNSLLLFMLLITPINVSGQSSLRRAISQFERGEYYEALQYYQTLMDSDFEFAVEDRIRIAHCYYELNNIDDAFTAFMDLEADGHLSGYDLFVYASATHRFGFYDGAIELYQRARPQNPGLQAQIDELISSCEWALENDDYLTNVRVNPTAINTYGQSFGIQFYGNGVVYSSASTAASDRAKDKQGLSFLSLYYSDVVDYNIANTRLFSRNLVFPYHVGAIAFTSDYSMMYYTRIVRIRGGGDRIKIFSVQYDGKDWVNEKEVPFNSEEFDNAYPTVSADDKYLYFSSNRPGGYGKNDIWRVERKPNRTYGTPSNLGPRVNTFGNERYPFISKDNILYFASDGHQGFGGLDLFRAEYQNGIWGNVQNMMQPFNSAKDDFGYVINPTDPTMGFISTNRQGDGSEDVIFYVQYLEEEETIEPEPEPEPEPLVIPEPVVEQATARPEPIVEVPVERPAPLVAEPVVIEPVAEEPKVDLAIFPSSFGGVVTSTFNGTVINGAGVTLADAFSGAVIGRASSGSNGRFSIAIPDTYRKEGQEFEISLVKEEFNSRKISANIMELNEVAAGSLTMTPIFKQAELNELSGISIPYRAEQITAEGLAILDRVAAYLLSNPNVVIKLNGHTEARGDRLANLDVSQRMAQKAESYLLTKGVPSDNIIPRGYGERYIMNKCRRGKLCNEEEHLANRRIEVVVWRFLQ